MSMYMMIHFRRLQSKEDASITSDVRDQLLQSKLHNRK